MTNDNQDEGWAWPYLLIVAIVVAAIVSYHI